MTATDTSPNHNTTTKSWSVNVPAVTPRSFTYDLNGNLTDDGPRSYTWDAADRLASVTVKAVGAIPAKIYAFSYDGSGHRVAESVDGTLLRKWIWAPGGAEPAAELDAASHLVKRFFAQGEQRSTDAGSTFASYYYTRDHLGSVRDVFNASGSAVARYSYSVYGVRTPLDLTTNAPTSSDSFGSDFGYTGHLTHVGSQLVLTLYRAYDPQTARWLSHDPIWENGGLNLYGYVGGSPLMESDPLGLAGLNSVYATLAAAILAGDTATISALLEAGVITSQQAAAAMTAAGATGAVARVASDPGKVQQCVAVANSASAGAQALADGQNPLPPMAMAYVGSRGAIPRLNGNSLNSLRPTFFYRLYNNDGTFLKNGIASQVIPEQRYSNSFMSDKYMETILFPNRLSAYYYEMSQNTVESGPLNKNAH